jgi:hypothetical protein
MCITLETNVKKHFCRNKTLKITISLEFSKIF